VQATDSGNLAITRPLAIQPNGGNVGIGIASPGALLDINGGATLREIASGSAPTAAAGKLNIYSDSTSHTLKISANGGSYKDVGLYVPQKFWLRRGLQQCDGLDVL
jgi:hypothetical protein